MRIASAICTARRRQAASILPCGLRRGQAARGNVAQAYLHLGSQRARRHDTFGGALDWPAVERVTQDGQLLREDCRTTLDALGLDAADLKRMQRAIARMQKYAGSIKDNLRLARGVRHGNADPQHLLVERRCFEQGNATGNVTLRVRHDAVTAASFVTPSDYARMDTGIRGH